MDLFSTSSDIHNGVSGHVETVVLLSHKKPDSTISVKVEFGEGEGKYRLIVWLQGTYCLYSGGKEKFGLANV